MNKKQNMIRFENILVDRIANISCIDALTRTGGLK